ncbi:putative quinol monooxygenase [Raineyella sp. LH-20]|uniref:putative quinol monooxygenase n=1 Tax=Raineyella sp. LH-20 TaxID=3081204 RepID=UPI002954863A|nr:antibiotic biosynthesis monooxygenase [Raineyella sp. LH-20]WOP18145.1 antibiotic biosynthesis monooxygenase [Raineyella sp. LH-20]
MTVVVTAVFHPLPGRKDDLVAAMQTGIEAVHREDDGCQLYAIHDAEDGTITMIEKWSSPEALAAHARGAAVGILNGDVEALLASPTVVTRMTPIPRGTDAQGRL